MIIIFIKTLFLVQKKDCFNLKMKHKKINFKISYPSYFKVKFLNVLQIYNPSKVFQALKDVF